MRTKFDISLEYNTNFFYIKDYDTNKIMRSLMIVSVLRILPIYEPFLNVPFWNQSKQFFNSKPSSAVFTPETFRDELAWMRDLDKRR